MNEQSDKYIIGLTGNIASGKSVVRKILERLGGYGIDADRLAHRALLKDTPSYRAVIGRFGKNILDKDGNIQRKALGEIVFADPQALRDLEAIIHPFVCRTIEDLIKRIRRKVLIIEAIKLIESGLTEYCNSLWVVSASFETRRSRLMNKRGFSAAEAETRIKAQPPQEEKISLANVVIQNDGSLMDVCQAVSEAWNRIDSLYRSNPTLRQRLYMDSNQWITLEQIQPLQADEFGSWLAQHAHAPFSHPTITLHEKLCIKPFFSLHFNDTILASVGWQIEDFIACIDEVYLSSSSMTETALYHAAKHFEQEAHQLGCEGMMWFIPLHYYNHQKFWNTLGYFKHTLQSLPNKSWQETAQHFLKNEHMLLVKPLSQQ